jgi:hypothetical protein
MTAPTIATAVLEIDALRRQSSRLARQVSTLQRELAAAVVTATVGVVPASATLDRWRELLPPCPGARTVDGIDRMWFRHEDGCCDAHVLHLADGAV